MDKIVEIITTLNEDEKADFARFIEQTSAKGQVLVLKLNSLLSSGELKNKEELMFALYGKLNYDAYKALRKRLLASLQRFIALKLIDEDSSNTSQIISLVNMSRYLYGHQAKELAFQYLKKAELKAKQNEVFEVLNSVYLLQLEYGEHLAQDEVLDTLAKWKENKQRLETTEKIEIALQLISRSLVVGSENKSNYYQELLENFDGDEEILSEPRFVYQLAALYRKQLLAKKDFFNLGSFLEEQFAKVLKIDSRKLKGNYYYIALLYLMAHIAYRNKDFSTSTSRTEKLWDAMQSLASIKKREFEVKYYLLKAGNCIYDNELKQAIELLTECKNNACFIREEKADINRGVSLTIALALNGNYKKAKLELHKIKRSDLWLTKQFGQEWLLKKSMIEALIYFELGDVSLLDAKIRLIKTKFNALLKEPIYQRALVFVKFIEKVDEIDLSKLEALVEKSFYFKPIEQEDLQAMTFYAWLKSKWLKKDTYEVLMELIVSIG